MLRVSTTLLDTSIRVVESVRDLLPCTSSLGDADIQEFLELRKNHGKEEARARDLFYGLWIPDLFMKRVEKNGNWTLMCLNECPGLYVVLEREARVSLAHGISLNAHSNTNT